MYRRNVLFERNGVVKVALVAAACALSFGYLAEKKLEAQRVDATAVAGESVQARPITTVRAAS